jgi:hypothetical protein
VGCFLEFLYTGDYYPKKVPGTRELETQPGVPAVDESGDQLLKHARVYTLAEKFGVEQLKSLATSKIHCVNSTAKGEIAYARYVYAYTDKDDTSIRAPVAKFWATRSHALRTEAEEEFRSICLEYPQFGYDVLSKFDRDMFTPALLTVSSSCARREAQAPRTRKVAPGRLEWWARTEACTTQQHLRQRSFYDIIFNLFPLRLHMGLLAIPKIWRRTCTLLRDAWVQERDRQDYPQGRPGVSGGEKCLVTFALDIGCPHVGTV